MEAAHHQCAASICLNIQKIHMKTTKYLILFSGILAISAIFIPVLLVSGFRVDAKFSAYEFLFLLTAAAKHGAVRYSTLAIIAAIILLPGASLTTIGLAGIIEKRFDTS